MTVTKFWVVLVEGYETKNRYTSREDANKAAEKFAIDIGSPAHVLELVATCEPQKGVVWDKE